ncbi:MAG: DUF177 domain-containing protein [Dehalococcoidia bacterium]|nr:DUF177 domain-containing protein [Dehalococcoidia bacterium]
MLEINVSQLLKSTIGTKRVVSIGDSVEVSGYGECQVNGQLQLMRTNRSILAQGKLNTVVAVSCARCLDTFFCPCEIEIEEEYYPITDVSTGIPLDEQAEPDDFVIDEHLVLDIGEAVRQYTLLAVPMKPLCRPDCPGIKLNDNFIKEQD